jgi:hypothetical protein
MQGYIEVRPRGTALSAIQRPDPRLLAIVTEELKR